MNLIPTIRGVPAQVILNVAEATLIHGALVSRRPFSVSRAKIMGYEFFYTSNIFESPEERQRIRHTLSAEKWTASVVLSLGHTQGKTGVSYQRAQGMRSGEPLPPAANELSWGNERYFQHIGSEFHGEETTMKTQMTMMRFMSKDTFHKYASA